MLERRFGTSKVVQNEVTRPHLVAAGGTCLFLERHGAFAGGDA
jgi:hypothetical protein